MKRMLLALMFASPLMALNECTALMRTANGYSLQVDGLSREVKPYDVDARVRSMNGEQLGRLAAIGGLKAHKMSNGDYRIEIGGGLKGGGAVGATIGAWLGWGAVTTASGLTAKGLVAAGTLVGGPVGGAVGGTVALGLHLVVFKPLSFVAAVAGGIAGGVATGPV